MGDSTYRSDFQLQPTKFGLYAHHASVIDAYFHGFTNNPDLTKPLHKHRSKFYPRSINLRSPPKYPIHLRAPPNSMKPMKLDLPCFYGEDPYGWLAMTECFLDYHEVEDHWKVMVATMHLGGDTALWMRWFELCYPRDSWVIFSDMLLHRFGPGEALNVNMGLSHSKQTGSVAEYVGLFIKLSCRAVGWIDEQLLGTFVRGLKEDIQDDFIALEPQSLARAMELAQIFENKLKKKTGRRNFNPRFISSQSTTCYKPQSTPNFSQIPKVATYHSPANRPIFRRTQAELQERHQKGMCFSYDEAYSPGHRCKQPHILMIESESLLDRVTESTIEIPEPNSDEEHQPFIEDTTIHLHALANRKQTRGRAMRLQGSIKGIPIRVFIDSTVDRNILNPKIATQLKGTIDAKKTEKIVVATCQSYSTKCMVYVVQVKLQAYEFQGNKGNESYANPPKSAVLAVLEKDEQFLHALATHGIICSTPLSVQGLLKQFSDLFEESLGLSLSRAIDHRISLLLGTRPINVKPYRYPYWQKAKIESQVNAMLQAEIIRRSLSPFSSPVLLSARNKGLGGSVLIIAL
ncbi:unnamed protein product [Prunus armeniaca]